MTLLRTWIVSVTACAMVIAAAEALMPDGAVKRVGKLTGGLILVLGLLQPLVKLDYDDWLDDLPAQTAGAVTQEELEGAAYAPMKSIIERELSAYIVDKGAQLGVTCTAQVVCETGEDGVLRLSDGLHKIELPVGRRALLDGMLVRLSGPTVERSGGRCLPLSDLCPLLGVQATVTDQGVELAPRQAAL